MKLLDNKKYYEHIWTKSNYVCEVPVGLLNKIRYQNSTDQTNMPDGRIMHQELIFDSIEKDGMQELLAIISPEKNTMRLESGNHRIKVAIDRGYTHLPCSFVLLFFIILECFISEMVIIFMKLMKIYLILMSLEKWTKPFTQSILIQKPSLKVVNLYLFNNHYFKKTVILFSLFCYKTRY